MGVTPRGVAQYAIIMGIIAVMCIFTGLYADSSSVPPNGWRISVIIATSTFVAFVSIVILTLRKMVSEKLQHVRDRVVLSLALSLPTMLILVMPILADCYLCILALVAVSVFLVLLFLKCLKVLVHATDNKHEILSGEDTEDWAAAVGRAQVPTTTE